MPSIGCGLAWSLVGPTPILDGPLLLVPVPERLDGALRALQLLRYLCVRVLLLTQSDDVATLLRSQGCLLFLGASHGSSAGSSLLDCQSMLHIYRAKRQMVRWNPTGKWYGGNSTGKWYGGNSTGKWHGGNSTNGTVGTQPVNGTVGTHLVNGVCDSCVARARFKRDSSVIYA